MVPLSAFNSSGLATSVGLSSGLAGVRQRGDAREDALQVLERAFDAQRERFQPWLFRKTTRLALFNDVPRKAIHRAIAHCKAGTKIIS
jgi:hypothetical protein